MTHSITAQVGSNREVSPQIYRMALKLPQRKITGQPGQFVHLRLLQGTTASILRRPFSIHRLTSGRLWLLYQVKGTVTRAMASLTPSDSVELMVPLGNGYRINRSRQEHLLVAGGMGLAPMLFMADHLKKVGLKHRILFGCRSSSYLLPAPTGCRVASDDGSCGVRGPVTCLLEAEFSRCNNAAVYACGPWPMLRATASLCRRYKVPCQVSLESFMACGVGACQGCAIRAADGEYLTVCNQGPVFDAELIDWTQEHTV